MKNENFILALTLLAQTHSNEIIINYVKPNGSIGDLTNGKPSISIKNCCAGAINRLKDAGFSLSMENGMLTVSDLYIN